MTTPTRRFPPILPAVFSSLGVAACGAGAALITRALVGNPALVAEGEHAGFVGVTTVVFVLGTLAVGGLVAWMGAHNLLLTGRPKRIWWSWCALLAAVAAAAVLGGWLS